MSMENKTSDVINNVCTIIGAAFLLKPIIDEAAKTLMPEMQKLTSGEMKDEIKQLTDGTQRDDAHGKKEHDSKDDEISELKRKLEALESKTDEHKSDN